VVLMDLQMPEMDGYQATAKLRADTRFATLPIIAMTAHATIEERQRCIAAGMNDHISKPIDPANLFETVGKFYKPTSSTGTLVKGEVKSPGVVTTDDNAIPVIADLDTADGLTRVAGNRKLYLKLLCQFVEQQGPAVTQITEALARSDAALAERLAHTLKGVAGNIGAKPVQAAAAVLEKAIRSKAPASDVESAKQQTAIVLTPLVDGLKTALSSSTPATSPTPAATVANPMQSRESANQLLKLLSEFDPGASDFIEANRATLQPLFADGTWADFEKLVQGYSFAEARARLEQVMKNFSPA
jgi:CheY-like chemotaxis protein